MRQFNKPVEVAIIGGGAAGCLAAIAAKEANPAAEVVIVEKASIRRGGSIACGMDAINVVVIPGISKVDDLVRAQMSAAQGILDAATREAEQLPARAEQEAREIIEKARSRAQEEARQMLTKAQAEEETAAILSQADEKNRETEKLAMKHMDKAVAYILERVVGRV